MARKAKEPKEKRLPVRVQTIVGACRGGADPLPHHPSFGGRRRPGLLAGTLWASGRNEVGRGSYRARAADARWRRSVRPLANLAGNVMSALGQQAGAVETAVRIISGAAATKPSAKEREYLVALLKKAAETLRKAEFAA